MVVHQDTGMNPRLEPLGQFRQAAEKPPAIRVGPENDFPAVSPVHRVIPAPCHHHSELPRHG